MSFFLLLNTDTKNSITRNARSKEIINTAIGESAPMFDVTCAPMSEMVLVGMEKFKVDDPIVLQIYDFEYSRNDDEKKQH